MRPNIGEFAFLVRPRDFHARQTGSGSVEKAGRQGVKPILRSHRLARENPSGRADAVRLEVA